MSVAYQSWEIGSGPTVGYKVQAHPGGGDGLNFRKLIYRPPQIPVDASTGKTLMPAKLMQQPQQNSHNNINNNNNSSTNTNINNSLVNGPSPSCGSLRPRYSTGGDDNTTRLVVLGAVAGSGGGGGAVVEAGRGGLGVSSSGLVAQKLKQLQEDVEMPCSSSSITSSISADSSDEDDKEVQSAFNGPLEQMDSLMTSLPVRRGLSKFYVGKSRSFTSLADVKSMNIKDLAKPENPYVKRRRLPPSYHHRDKFPPPRVSTGISKKPPSNGTTLTLAVAMSTKGEGLESEESLSSGTRWHKSCRSFSLTDLQKA